MCEDVIFPPTVLHVEGIVGKKPAGGWFTFGAGNNSLARIGIKLPREGDAGTSFTTYSKVK